MAKFYYNGVLLPEIPDDGFQYHVITTHSSAGYYYLFSLPSRCYHIGGKLYDPDTGSKINRQAYSIAPSEVENATIWNPDGSAVSAEVYVSNTVMTTVWADYDIPNGSADATEIYFHGSNPVPESGGEPTTDILYTVNGSSLTAVANAIRGKAETTGELAFPDGYVSAVNDISSVSDLSNAKDIAFGGDESGGKYVIEDETITPLFNQVKRITETEDAMTFEGATESLLNVVPGGGLPDAESASFGSSDASVEFGLTINDGKKCSNLTSSTSFHHSTTYSANQAFAILGVRVFCGAYTPNLSVYLWNANGGLVCQVDGLTVEEDGYADAYFDAPVNVGIDEEFTLSTSKYSKGSYIWTGYVTLSSKITYQRANYGSTNPPTANEATTHLRGVVTPIMGAISTVELPDDYQITRTTMNDIANEVKRISGTTGKMTTSQILTALQSIQLQDKSVTPTAEVQTVTPDDGYFALSSVTVGAITEENEAVTEIVNEKMEVVANDTY